MPFINMCLNMCLLFPQNIRVKVIKDKFPSCALRFLPNKIPIRPQRSIPSIYTVKPGQREFIVSEQSLRIPVWRPKATTTQKTCEFCGRQVMQNTSTMALFLRHCTTLLTIMADSAACWWQYIPQQLRASS
jgi:hypothetical protein